MTTPTFSRDESVVASVEAATTTTAVATTASSNPLENMFPSMPIPNDEQMAQMAARMREDVAKLSERLTGNTTKSIKLKGSAGFITEDNGPIRPIMTGVIVGFTSYNSLFGTQYTPGKFDAPTCYAINPIPEKLKPADNAQKPEAATCAVCPKNAFKSAANGRGKACRNARRLAVLLTDGKEPLDKAELMTLAVPPTSLKAFDKYVSSLAVKHGCMPLAVLTEFALDPNFTYPVLRFTVSRPLTSAEVMVAYGWVDMADATINAPVDYSSFSGE